MRVRIAVITIVLSCGMLYPSDMRSEGPDILEAVSDYIKTLGSIASITFIQTNNHHDSKTGMYIDGGDREVWQIRRRNIAGAAKDGGVSGFDFRVERQRRVGGAKYETIDTEVERGGSVFALSKGDGVLHIYKAESTQSSCITERTRTTAGGPVIFAPIEFLFRDEETKSTASVLRFSYFLRDVPGPDVLRSAILKSEIYRQPDVGGYNPSLVGRRYWDIKYPVFGGQMSDGQSTAMYFTKWDGRHPLVDQFRGVRGAIITYESFAVPQKNGDSLVLATGIANSIIGDRVDYISRISEVSINRELSDAAFSIDPAEAAMVIDHAASKPVDP